MSDTKKAATGFAMIKQLVCCSEIRQLQSCHPASDSWTFLFTLGVPSVLERVAPLSTHSSAVLPAKLCLVDSERNSLRKSVERALESGTR